MAKVKSKKKPPIKTAIIGLGRAGFNMHGGELDKYKGKFQIVAGCDTTKSMRDRFTDKYTKAYATADYSKILKDPDVELVSIANRSTDHFEYAVKALKAGKEVFLEKPITITAAEARKLHAVAKKSKGNLYIRHNRRFEPAFTHIKQVIDSGILGDVYEIKLCRHSYSRRDDWQTIISCGGGQLLNWGPHIIDHALRFVDGKVENIYGYLKKVAATGDAEDHVKVIVKGKNGRLVDLEISGGVAIPSPVYAVYGTKGTLISENEQQLQMKYIDPKQKFKSRKPNAGNPKAGYGNVVDKIRWVEKTIKVAPKPKTQMSDIWGHLYETIRNRKKFPITLEESVQVMEVVEKVKAGTPFRMKKK